MTKLTPADLAHFTGTAEWYRHGLNRRMLYTDGVQYLAEKGGAYWLLDKIACLQLTIWVEGNVILLPSEH